MQSFLTVFLAAIVAFFAFAMMPPESETDGDLIAEAEPPRNYRAESKQFQTCRSVAPSVGTALAAYPGGTKI